MGGIPPTDDSQLGSELDFFIVCLRRLLDMDRAAREFTRIYSHPNTRNILAEQRDVFREDFVRYFRLQPHMDSWAVYWELLRLADLPAGSLEKEKP